MTNSNIELEGFEQFRAAMRKYPDELERRLGSAMGVSLEEWRDEVSSYPGATAGNQPKTFTSGASNTWYERGFGSRWARQDGSYGARASSEQLGRSWNTRVLRPGGGIVRGVLGNDATYAPLVHDDDDQTSAHAGHGWRKVKESFEERRDKITRIVQKVIENALEWVARQTG